MPRVAVWNSGDRWGDPNLVWGPLAPTDHTMSNDNRISATMSDADKAAILAAIAVIKTKTASYLASLSDEERQQLVKMGDKSIAFDAKIASYEAARADLVPSFVNLGETNKDRALFAPMMEIWRQFGPLCRDWESTLMLLGHEIMVSNNVVYRSIREAARMQVNGAQAIYDDLKERYPGNPRPNTPPPAPH